MTSAIPATQTAFEIIARAEQPISVKTIKDAVEATPEPLKSKFKVTEDSIYRDLKEMVTTNFFGDKTPKLADDVAARVGALAPAEKPTDINYTAAGFAETLTSPLAPGLVYENAHAISAVVTGAVVAMQAGLASTTPEQKADKEALIQAFSTKIANVNKLLMFAGVWASLAKPVGDGTFALPHETATALIESVQAGDVTEKLQPLLFKELDPNTIGMTSEPPEPTAEELETTRAVLKREQTRAIGGKSEAELEALYKDVAAKAQIARITYRPETFRTEKYQQILDAVYQSPLTQVLVPILKEIIGRQNVATRRTQKANYKEISEQRVDRVNDKQLQAVYKTAQRVAERMGAGNPSITRIAHDVLNAWVSSVDIDHPHITYFSRLQHIVWDREKGDWLKFWVDADDKFCDANTPGAKEVSGERLVEVVFAHELMHIFEGAVLNQFLLMVLLGTPLRADDAALHGEGCLCCGGINTDKVALAKRIVADPEIQEFMADPSKHADRLALARSLGKEQELATHLKYSRLLAANAAGANSPLTAEQRHEMETGLSSLGSFFLVYQQQMEWTADYGAMRLLGPDAPRWMAMVFDMVTNTTGQGSPGERLEDFKESYTRNQRDEAKEALFDSEEGGGVSHMQYAMQSTHPTHMLRAIGNFRHAESKGAQEVWQFEKLPASQRILGAAQAVESEIERLEDKHAEFQHGNPKNKPALARDENDKINEDAHHERAIAEQTERMRIVTSEIAKLVFADGMDNKEGRIPYGVQVGAYLKMQGVPLFRQAGETNPLAALLGGGGAAHAPACVKVAKQIAEELEKIVDAASLSEEEQAPWQVVIKVFRDLAAEDGKGQVARIARTQRKAAIRAIRD